MSSLQKISMRPIPLNQMPKSLNNGEIQGGLFTGDGVPVSGNNTLAQNNDSIQGGLFTGNGVPVSCNNTLVPDNESVVACLLGVSPETFYNMPDYLKKNLVEQYNNAHPDNPIPHKVS